MEDKVLKAGAPLTFEQKRALMDRFFATNEYIDAVPGAWEDDPSTEPSVDDPEPPFPDYDSEGEEEAEKKYNPNQPRKPAGSEHGGEFASTTGGGGATGAGAEVAARLAAHKGVPSSELNTLDGGVGPSIQYHGNAGPGGIEWKGQERQFTGREFVYIQQDPKEAVGYAENRHVPGATRSKNGEYVYQVRRAPGAAKNVEADVMDIIENGGPEDFDAMLRAVRDEGYRYAFYTHPTFTGDGEQKVLVSLHPKEDLKILQRNLTRVYKYNPHHDARGRFARSDGSPAPLASGAMKPTKKPRQHRRQYVQAGALEGASLEPGSLRGADWIPVGNGVKVATTLVNKLAKDDIQLSGHDRPFSKTDDGKAVADIVRKQLLAAEIPGPHLRGLTSMGFHMHEAYGVGMWSSWGMGTNSINFAPKRKDLVHEVKAGLVFHEIGHNALFVLTQSGKAKLLPDLDRPRISLYAQKNPQEHFCEAYKAYIVGGNERARLKKLEPNTYKVIHRVFTDASLFK